MGAVVELTAMQHSAVSVLETTRRGHLHVVAAPVVPIRVRPSAEVLKRRRILVAALAVTLLAAFSVVIGVSADRLGELGRPSNQVLEWLDATGSTGSILAPDTDGWVRYQVRPGDSLWSIAERVDSDRSVSALVDDMTSQLGASGIRPGQIVTVRA
jgi:hypothetical protein